MKNGRSKGTQNINYKYNFFSLHKTSYICEIIEKRFGFQFNFLCTVTNIVVDLQNRIYKPDLLNLNYLFYYLNRDWGVCGHAYFNQ